MCRQRLGGGREGARVPIFGQPRGVQHLGELGGLLRRRRIARYRDGVEVERLEELPLLVGRHQRVLHELLKGLEALHVYADGILVALLGAVEGVLFRMAYPPQEAHGSLEAAVSHVLVRAVGSLEGLGRALGVAAVMLSFSLVGGVCDEMCRVSIAQHGECFVVPRLSDEAVAGQVAACWAATDEVLFREEGLGSGVVSRGKMDLS